MADPWTPADEVALASHVVSQVVGMASGGLVGGCFGNLPRDTFFVGNLRNEDPSNPSPARLTSELLSKLAPTGCGLEIKLDMAGGVATLDITARWAVYYRVFPDRDEQLRYQTGVASPPEVAAEDPEGVSSEDELGEPAPEPAPNDASTDGEAGDDGVIPPPPAPRGRTRSETLVPKFRKVPCSASAVVTVSNSGGAWSVNAVDLDAAMAAELDRATAIARGDPDRIRAERSADESIGIPVDAAGDQARYRAFISTKSVEADPAWKVSVLVSVARASASSNEVDLRIEIANSTPGRYTSNGKPSPNHEPFIFEAGLDVGVRGAATRPFELLLVPRGFRTDRRLWARGLNVGVSYDASGPRYSTDPAPTYAQARYVTQTMAEAAFSALAADPVPNLEAIGNAMRQYLSTWDAALATYRAEPGWTAEYEQEFLTDRALYEDEITRFDAGLALVRTDPDVRLAFELMNEVFSLGPNTAWRLFQLVFIVSQVPGIASLKTGQDQAERSKVDIIYYATGGGKTEAYLGTLVFHAFFDRLRGKSAGVTGWIRFPLRLLTLQQTQRLVDVLSLADLVRSRHTDARLSGSGARPFSVGYFVGEEGSPNEIADPSAVSERERPRVMANWSIATDERARQAWKRVSRCPSCRTPSITVDFDPARVIVLHRCTNKGCAFPDGVLPIFITDNEIYRYLPTVLVGTIDKLAVLGNQRKLAMVFGRVQGRCPLHGYYFKKCSLKGCRERLTPSVVPGLSGPSIFVQDELHLLREGLGTFDSHYETFSQELSRRFGGGEIKQIASSATIEAFERQVEHLYGRQRTDGRVFPGGGPRLGESFYARTLDHAQRLYVGVLPHNKTLLNAILEMLELYHRVAQGLRSLGMGAPSPFVATVSPGTPEWSRLTDLYATSLTYFLARRDLDSASNDIAADVSPNLVAEGLPPLTKFHLTSEASTDEVERTLTHLTNASPVDEADAVLATNMVSHGVDVDRLNAMLFYGMPRQNSEYIQASSRVGRSHCGVVFVCLHPARERDQSHYEYFVKYHEFLGQLVEPVAINRHAEFAMERTIPGLFMADILQIVATSGSDDPNRYYMLDTLKQKIAAGTITQATVGDVLRAAYFGAAGDAKGEVAPKVQRLLDQVVSATAGQTFVSDALIPRPLMSLREVDEQVEIELDSEATSWSLSG